MTEDTAIPPYDGNDMAGYIMSVGFALPPHSGGVRSVTNVRDMAVIVTEAGVFIARPHRVTGFMVEQIARVSR